MGEEYARFPHYAIEVPPGSGGGRAGHTITAEGAANSVAFANTALTARADKAELDHGVINAVFQHFAVSLPVNDGTWRGKASRCWTRWTTRSTRPPTPRHDHRRLRRLLTRA